MPLGAGPRGGEVYSRTTETYEGWKGRSLPPSSDGAERLRRQKCPYGTRRSPNLLPGSVACPKPAALGSEPGTASGGTGKGESVDSRCLVGPQPCSSPGDSGKSYPEDPLSARMQSWPRSPGTPQSQSQGPGSSKQQKDAGPYWGSSYSLASYLLRHQQA